VIYLDSSVALAAEKRDEVAAFHSITSSARPSSDSGRVSGLEIDDQLYLGGLLHRESAGFSLFVMAVLSSAIHFVSCRGKERPSKRRGGSAGLALPLAAEEL
jgi:hypothetical protein